MRRSRNAFIVICLVFISFAPVFSQNGYFPPNPIVPPVIPQPVLVPLVPLAPPVISNGEKKETTTPKSSLPSTLTEATNPLSLLNTVSGEGTDSEGLETLSALLGGGMGASGGSDAATLQKVLGLLEKQNAQEKNSMLVPPEKPPLPTASVPVKPANITSGAEIVRFTVNGYNIGSTITSIVSSTLSNDGSFLLTGVRTYFSSGRYLRETFYLLCKKTGKNSYHLFTDVSQDSVNEYSYLYQAVRKSPFKGTLTGDLLVFRSADSSWNLDLLIRVITP